MVLQGTRPEGCCSLGLCGAFSPYGIITGSQLPLVPRPVSKMACYENQW